MNIFERARIFAAAAAVFGVFGATGDALASSGTISGRIMHYQNQGNYCPNFRNCTGAKYVQSQYQTYMPIREVKVYIHRTSDNAIIGQGATDSNGYFSIFWFDGSSSGNISANFDWRGEHRDNKFYIRDVPSWQLWSFWTWPFTLNNGVNTDVGSQYWGGAGFPHEVTNLYDGAAMTWINALSQSNRMWNHLPNVEIRSNAAGTGAFPWANVVDMQWSVHFEGFTIMHEIGHVANYKAHRDQSYQGVRSYCFPNTGSSGCDHSFETQEWAHAGFEEGTASMTALVALHFPSAPQPHTCRTNGACPTNNYNFETSVMNANCTAALARQENNVTRYHWDNYDSVSDFAGEDLQRGIWEIFDTIHAFNNGTGGLQKDEHFGTDFDGHSMRDFEYNWWVWGTSSWDELINNCGAHIGDL